LTELIVLIGMVGLAACALVALEGFARAPVLVAGLILFHGAASITFAHVQGPVISVASITVFVPDLLFALVAGAAFVRMLGLRRLAFPQIGLVIIAGLALFSAARGAAEDVAGSVNEFRGMLYFLSGALYFVTVEPTKEFLRKVTQYLYAAAILILATSILFWIAFLTGISLPEFIATAHETDGFRVVHADRTILFAQASLIALPAWQQSYAHGHRLERFLAIIFIPAILIMQWRVIWILFIAGLAVAGWRGLALGRKVLIPVIGTALVALLLLPSIFAAGDAPSLDESLGAQATTADTFFWRVEGWRALAGSGAESTSEVFLGAPYGRGKLRVINEQEITSQAHSFYLDHYLRHGLLGLIALVLLYLWAIRRLWTTKNGNEQPGLTNPQMVLVIAVTQLIIFITFTPGMEQGLLAGIVLSVALKGTTRPV
jgi:hypothetical protein